MGIRGEPTVPDDPAQGLVWTAIVRQADKPGSESDFVSAGDSPRASFHKHPWSIGGGGAAAVKAVLDESATTTLEALTTVSGVMAIPGDDEVLVAKSRVDWIRKGVSETCLAPFAEGELVRDYQIHYLFWCIFPIDESGRFRREPTADKHLWNYRALLRRGICFGKTREERGMDWREWAMIVKDKFPLARSIIFPEIASHNHFVLEAGRLITKQSLPLFRLHEDAKDEDYLNLMGLLSSPLVCFWMKQVCYPKERATGDISKEKCRPETNRYVFNSTSMGRFPIPDLTRPEFAQVRWLALNLQKLGSPEQRRGLPAFS